MLPVVGYKSVVCTHFPWVSLNPDPITAATWGRQVKSVTVQTPRQVQEECREEVLQNKGEQVMVHAVPTIGTWLVHDILECKSEEGAWQVLNVCTMKG